MAKKITSKQLKSGEIRLYIGGKVATREQKKALFKENPNIDIPLGKEDKKLLGQIKGGIKRAQKSGTRIGGKFIEGRYDRAAEKLKRMGIDISVQLKKNNYKSLEELFKAKPDVKTALLDIMHGAGLHNWYEPNKAVDIIKDYLGENIIVNGQKVSKNKAVSLLMNFENNLKAKVDHFMSSVRLRFEGIDNMYFDLPDIEDIDEEESAADFNALYGNEQEGMYQIYKSE